MFTAPTFCALNNTACGPFYVTEEPAITHPGENGKRHRKTLAHRHRCLEMLEVLPRSKSLNIYTKPGFTSSAGTVQARPNQTVSPYPRKQQPLEPLCAGLPSRKRKTYTSSTKC